MATQTPYFGLTKSGGTEAALIGVYNNNMDIIDLEIWQSMVRAAINLAPIYDETEAYVEGAYCTLLETVQQTVTGFHLYKCTTDTPDPAGTFDPSSWSEVDITSEMGHGGGGGGGHIYLDNSGNVMTQRTKAKFEGAYTTDDGTNDITNVAVMRSMHRAEFEQLSEAEKQGIIFVDDETGAVEDKFQPVIYSEDEREIGVWTDGKPLYQKTVVSPSGVDISVSSSSWTNTGIDVSSLNIEKIISSFGLSTDGTYQGTILAYVENDNLMVQTTRNNNGWVVSFTIQYTKTTDTAGSGTWTPQGVPAVHYSTDEQVIGTWIDGSTLYQKTIEYNCQDTSNTQVAYTGNTGDKIVQLVDYYFINSQNVQIRLMWAGQAFWDFISGTSTLTVKRNTNDANWQANVKFIATVQYIKTS